MIDRERLEQIVRAAGALALKAWPGQGPWASPRENPLKTWYKSDGQPVCEADMAVDAFLRAELGALLPQAGWLSEETVDSPGQRDGDLIWLVDPIDGTRDFVAGRDGWAVSVALISCGRPLIGLLHAPARGNGGGGELWLAEEGRGATRDGRRLRASTRADLAGARVPARLLGPEDADLTPVSQPNSIALRIAMVAADEADLLATLRWGYEWDIGAACLIAREAGAAVSDAFGQALGYNKPDPRAFGVLVSAPAIHAAAVARLGPRARHIAGA
ncbi:MAG TPA: 3'(2'),5'-bisphosphate nucleotidase CysQ [Novosphingobium sp.]|nr:3'(2'),5'-bisphosphate nucleotidase CysQ [Novosphingobium sp.]HZV10141.1 3'(2'),5'-bisphosphate nucleotidase CysQ [Novosphingobium sp.]